MSMFPLSQPSIKLSSQAGENEKIEKFNIQLAFKGDPSKVRHVSLLGTFDYFVQTKIKMQLVGLMHVSVDTPLGASKILSDGHLELKQNKPVLIDSITRSLYDVDPLTDIKYEQFSMEEIIEAYNLRNERVEYHSTQIVQPMGSAFTTTLDLQIHVPKTQEIVYKPGVMQTLKFAWVQYVMILIPVLAITKIGLSSMFKYRILDAFLVSDLKVKRKII